MSENKTEEREVTVQEFQKIANEGKVEIIGARAVVDVFDKDGNHKSTLNFSTDALEEEDNADS